MNKNQKIGFMAFILLIIVLFLFNYIFLGGLPKEFKLKFGEQDKSFETSEVTKNPLIIQYHFEKEINKEIVRDDSYWEKEMYLLGEEPEQHCPEDITKCKRKEALEEPEPEEEIPEEEPEPQ